MSFCFVLRLIPADRDSLTQGRLACKLKCEKSFGHKTIANTGYFRDVAFLAESFLDFADASAASFAISERRFAESFAARALPPLDAISMTVIIILTNLACKW